MPVVQTQTPIWSIWAAAMDNAFQLQAFVLSTGNKCAPSAGAGLTVNVAAGTVVVNGNTTTTAISAGSVTPTSPVNNPRRDIVFISSAGTLTLTQGTEAPAPVPPALPAGACLIAVLFIPTGAADYSAGFPNAGIEDMRFIFAYDVSTGIPSFHSLGTAAAQAAAGNHTTPAATATVGGHVPTPPNNTTTFLRGDGTFAAPHASQSKSATITADITTTSTTYVDATGLTVTITTTGGDVLIWFSGLVYNVNANAAVNLTIAKDGTNVGTTAGLGQVYDVTAGASRQVAFNWHDAAPTAGAHTYKIQWKVASGTGTITGDPRSSIVVLET